MVEAMSCGTPVIGLRYGAVPELITHEKTGFLCNNTDEMIDAVKRIDAINPEDVRKRGEEFSRRNMAINYINLYRKVILGESW